jgi:hypothetical protein
VANQRLHWISQREVSLIRPGVGDYPPVWQNLIAWYNAHLETEKLAAGEKADSVSHRHTTSSALSRNTSAVAGDNQQVILAFTGGLVSGTNDLFSSPNPICAALFTNGHYFGWAQARPQGIE